MRRKKFLSIIVPHQVNPMSKLYDENFSHMYLLSLNRGILMTPFHNMALIATDTTEAEVDYHTKVFREAVQTLFG